RCKSAARHVPHVALSVNDQQLGCFPVGALGGDHRRAARQDVPLFDNATRIASMISAAECSGRFKVDGWASGTARACRGVALSPGSSGMDTPPATLAASAQTDG